MKPLPVALDEYLALRRSLGYKLWEECRLLRHSQPNTTQIYAKVDIESLRGIAVAWPAGAP